MCRTILLISVFLTVGGTCDRSVRTTSDRLFQDPYFEWIRGKRVGLVTNATGIDAGLVSTLERLETHGQVRLVALFGPEHGLFGQAQAGEKVESTHRVYSLYGETRSPTAEMLNPVDVLIYDIQDVGVRFYTYISTMLECMKAAAREGIPFVVLDRPNPITGSRVEGPVLEPGFESFVGIHTLPIRYGMTAGELAAMLNDELEVKADLRIVPLEGWRRSQWFDAGSLPWVMPSPNMPTLETAVVYPGTCLIEGTNLSEGRGTTRPFELIGAPWLDAAHLARRLNSLDLPGVAFRVQSFTPTFSKYAGEPCQGVQLHVLDRESFLPVQTTLHLISEVRRLHPQHFSFREQGFDRLAGTSSLREALEQGRPVEEIVREWIPALEEFQRRRERYLLYP